MNRVECWSSILTRKQIRRGTYESVPQLIAPIKRLITTHNEHARPSVWTKSAEQILAKTVRQETSGTEH
jgi:hypothetical protein